MNLKMSSSYLQDGATPLKKNLEFSTWPSPLSDATLIHVRGLVPRQGLLKMELRLEDVTSTLAGRKLVH